MQILKKGESLEEPGFGFRWMLRQNKSPVVSTAGLLLLAR